ncbi:hypothetical protein ACFL20_09765 [Spirochaetota bacterium]
MKKFSLLSILLISITAFSCKNALHDIKPKAADFSSAYRYVGVMYDQESGQEINDEILSDSLYSQYSDEIQKSLNIMMRFPIKTDAPTSKADGNGTNIWEVPWYTTLPVEIYNYRDDSSDFMADSIAQGLINYLDSDEGQLAIEAQMNEINTRADNLIKFATGELTELDEDEISTALLVGGVILDAVAIQTATGTIAGMNILSMGSMLQGYFHHKAIMKKLNLIIEKLAVIEGRIKQIQEHLVIIEEKIDRIDNKIDLIADLIEGTSLQIQLNQARTNIVNAQNKIEAVYSHINSLSDPEDKKNYIKSLFIEDDEYDYLYTSAFNSAYLSQEKIKEFNVGKDANETFGGHIKTEGIKVRRWINNYLYYVNPAQGFEAFTINSIGEVNSISSFNIKELLNSMYVSSQDIELIKRLSLERLSLLAVGYNGQELIDHRAYFAKEDLKKLNSIKEDLNKTISNINNYVITNNFTMIDDVVHIDYDLYNSTSYEQNLTVLPYTCIIGHCTQTSWSTDEVYNFHDRREFSVNSSPGYFGYRFNFFNIEQRLHDIYDISWYDNIIIEDSNRDINVTTTDDDELHEPIKNYIFNESTFRDRIIATLASLAHWETVLRAHIKAGELGK